MKRFHFTTFDYCKFFILFAIFLILLFSYENAYSPYVQTTFDSASIENQEQKALRLFAPKEESVQEESKESPQVEEKKLQDTVTISFRPDFISIDSNILDLVRANANSIYFEPKISPLHLIFDSERKEPRGQVSGNNLILSGKIPSESENLKVFVHELGHIIDIFYLKQKEDGSDISDEFYTLSWDSYNIKKSNAKIADFVSGYALSNKYEDFAESFAFYIFHNEEFARRAKNNSILGQKYNFFHTYVFDDDTFVGT